MRPRRSHFQTEHSTFIVALDGILTNYLTLDAVITRLLNEEVRQVQAAKSESEQMEGALAAIAKKRPIQGLPVTTVRVKGYYQTD